MKVIGLTGSVGSGKSSAAHILERDYGAFLLLADEIGRKLMEPGEISYREIRNWFGSGILKEDQTIDRELLSARVFSDPEQLKKLNSFVHPHVTGVIKEALALLREDGSYPYAVVESAILFDVHYEEFCDEVWYVCAEDEIRKKRLMDSRGYTEEKIQSILRQQKSHEEYRRRSDYQIDNSRSLTDLEENIKKIIIGR